MTDLKRCAYFSTSALTLSDATAGVYHATGIILYDLVGMTAAKDVNASWIAYLSAKTTSGNLAIGSFLRFSISNVVARLNSSFKTVLDFDLTWDESTAYADRELDPDLTRIALICESSSDMKLGYAPSVLPETAFGQVLPDGMAFASRNSDIAKIIDKFGTGSGDPAFDGTRTVKRSGLPQVAPGGDTITEFLNNYFYPFVPASVSLNSLSTYQYGTSNSFNLSGAISLNDETQVYDRRVYDVTSGKVLLGRVTDNNYSYGLLNVVASRSYQVDIDVENNGNPVTLSSPVRGVTFVYPFLYGMSSSGSLTGSSFYSSLTPLVAVKSNKKVTLTGNDAYIYFAYPASYGALSSIYDQNGFDVTSSFAPYQLSVTSSGLNYNDWTVLYQVYKSANLTAVDGKPFTFNF